MKRGPSVNLQSTKYKKAKQTPIDANLAEHEQIKKFVRMIIFQNYPGVRPAEEQANIKSSIKKYKADKNKLDRLFCILGCNVSSFYKDQNMQYLMELNRYLTQENKTSMDDVYKIILSHVNHSFALSVLTAAAYAGRLDAVQKLLKFGKMRQKYRSSVQGYCFSERNYYYEDTAAFYDYFDFFDPLSAAVDSGHLRIIVELLKCTPNSDFLRSSSEPLNEYHIKLYLKEDVRRAKSYLMDLIRKSSKKGNMYIANKFLDFITPSESYFEIIKDFFKKSLFGKERLYLAGMNEKMPELCQMYPDLKEHFEEYRSQVYGIYSVSQQGISRDVVHYITSFLPTYNQSKVLSRSTIDKIYDISTSKKNKPK